MFVAVIDYLHINFSLRLEDIIERYRKEVILDGLKLGGSVPTEAPPPSQQLEAVGPPVMQRKRSNSKCITHDTTMPGDRAELMPLRKGILNEIHCLYTLQSSNEYLVFPNSENLIHNMTLEFMLRVVAHKYNIVLFQRSIRVALRRIVNQAFVPIELVITGACFCVPSGKKCPVYGKWRELYVVLKYHEQKLLFYEHENVSC